MMRPVIDYDLSSILEAKSEPDSKKMFPSGPKGKAPKLTGEDYKKAQEKTETAANKKKAESWRSRIKKRNRRLSAAENQEKFKAIHGVPVKSDATSNAPVHTGKLVSEPILTPDEIAKKTTRTDKLEKGWESKFGAVSGINKFTPRDAAGTTRGESPESPVSRGGSDIDPDPTAYHHPHTQTGMSQYDIDVDAPKPEVAGTPQDVGDITHQRDPSTISPVGEIWSKESWDALPPEEKEIRANQYAANISSRAGGTDKVYLQRAIAYLMNSGWTQLPETPDKLLRGGTRPSHWQAGAVPGYKYEKSDDSKYANLDPKEIPCKNCDKPLSKHQTGKCKTCNGKTTILTDTKCSVCDGTGHDKTNYKEKCSACHGAKVEREDCPDCYVPELKRCTGTDKDDGEWVNGKFVLNRYCNKDDIAVSITPSTSSELYKKHGIDIPVTDDPREKEKIQRLKQLQKWKVSTNPYEQKLYEVGSLYRKQWDKPENDGVTDVTPKVIDDEQTTPEMKQQLSELRQALSNYSHEESNPNPEKQAKAEEYVKNTIQQRPENWGWYIVDASGMPFDSSRKEYTKLYSQGVAPGPYKTQKEAYSNYLAYKNVLADRAEMLRRTDKRHLVGLDDDKIQSYIASGKNIDNLYQAYYGRREIWMDKFVDAQVKYLPETESTKLPKGYYDSPKSKNFQTKGPEIPDDASPEEMEQWLSNAESQLHVVPGTEPGWYIVDEQHPNDPLSKKYNDSMDISMQDMQKVRDMLTDMEIIESGFDKNNIAPHDIDRIKSKWAERLSRRYLDPSKIKQDIDKMIELGDFDPDTAGSKHIIAGGGDDGGTKQKQWGDVERKISASKPGSAYYEGKKYHFDNFKGQQEAKLATGLIQSIADHAAVKCENCDGTGKVYDDPSRDEKSSKAWHCCPVCGDPKAPKDVAGPGVIQSYFGGDLKAAMDKGIFCPLLLDWKFDNNRKVVKSGLRAWTVDEVKEAMKPSMNEICQKFVKASGNRMSHEVAFSYAEMQLYICLINDRGESPFAKYANDAINKCVMHGMDDVLNLIRVGRGNRDLMRHTRVGSLDATVKNAVGDEASLASLTPAGQNVGTTVKCDKCDGKKFTFVYKTCPVCHGIGVDKEGKRCLGCEGEGTIQPMCPACKNTDHSGFSAPDKLNKCPTCKGTAREIQKCDKCDGTGQKRIVIATPGQSQGQDIAGGIEIGPDGKVVRQDISVSGAPEQDASQMVELSERLNKNSKFIYNLMDRANLSSQSKAIVAFAFGFDKSKTPKTPTEITKVLSEQTKQQQKQRLDDLMAENVDDATLYREIDKILRGTDASGELLNSYKGADPKEVEKFVSNKEPGKRETLHKSAVDKVMSRPPITPVRVTQALTNAITKMRNVIVNIDNYRKSAEAGKESFPENWVDTPEGHKAMDRDLQLYDDFLTVKKDEKLKSLENTTCRACKGTGRKATSWRQQQMVKMLDNSDTDDISYYKNVMYILYGVDANGKPIPSYAGPDEKQAIMFATNKDPDKRKKLATSGTQICNTCGGTGVIEGTARKQGIADTEIDPVTGKEKVRTPYKIDQLDKEADSTSRTKKKKETTKTRQELVVDNRRLTELLHLNGIDTRSELVDAWFNSLKDSEGRSIKSGEWEKLTDDQLAQHNRLLYKILSKELEPKKEIEPEPTMMVKADGDYVRKMKTDEEGKPVLDAQGKPIPYTFEDRQKEHSKEVQSAWDRMYKDAVENAVANGDLPTEAAQKAMKPEEVTKLFRAFARQFKKRHFSAWMRARKSRTNEQGEAEPLIKPTSSIRSKKEIAASKNIVGDYEIDDEIDYMMKGSFNPIRGRVTYIQYITDVNDPNKMTQLISAEFGSGKHKVTKTFVAGSNVSKTGRVFKSDNSDEVIDRTIPEGYDIEESVESIKKMAYMLCDVMEDLQYMLMFEDAGI